MKSFDGTVDELATVNVKSLQKFLLDIPADDWRKLTDEKFRDWGQKFRPLADDLCKKHYPDCKVSGVGMFVMEPGQEHPPHKDVMPDAWVVRVHVPIFTSKDAVIVFAGKLHHLQVGKAYRFNPRASHAVYNGGKMHRAHFVFDVAN